ncbi:nucleoside triphosphate pyrophosphatase [Melioribacteraceae bacterium 4301-Me]|uniref:Maf family protein n=1 Tax=Pyranulibacter aquaticus TaxID=3163344 RepID=UPI003598F55C
MVNSTIPIFLASKSPRRKKILSLIGIRFKTLSIKTSEEVNDGEHPAQLVKRIANEKMNAAITKVKSGIIITADTIVVIDKKIMGKPKNKKQAFEFLKILSGRTHTVYTGYVVFNTINGKKITGCEKTYVTFRDISDSEIKKYIAAGTPFDKAGAYGIQDDFGAVFIEKIKGCYYNVVGLPLSKIYLALKKVS